MIQASASRIHPEYHGVPQDVPLSILDATVANFSPAAAAWIYNKHPSLSPQSLVLSLTKTLESYPQWGGQLHPVEYSAIGDHTQRYNRLVISYGRSTDPGVEVVVAHNPIHLVAQIPDFRSRSTTTKIWNASTLSMLKIFPTKPELALRHMGAYENLPAMIVQITTFSCGSVVLGIKLAHPLADAYTLSVFMKDWSLVHKAAESLHPIFSPSLIDANADGDIDAPLPDTQLIEIAQALPINHFDWWEKPEDVPAAVKGVPFQPGDKMPWSEWDTKAPVEYYLIHFSPEDIERIYKLVDVNPCISKLDVLQAYLGLLVIRARRDEVREMGQQTVSLNITLGARDRGRLPCPPHSLGSPIFLTRVQANIDGETLGGLASKIRATLQEYTPAAIGAMLHALMYEISPQRLWGAFLGSRNTIITSWLRLGVYEIDFGAGHPRLVEGVMPCMDGCVQVVETGPKSDSRWYSGGVTMSLNFRKDVLSRILKGHEKSLRDVNFL